MMSDLSPSRVNKRREFSHVTSQTITETGATLRKRNLFFFVVPYISPCSADTQIVLLALCS